MAPRALAAAVTPLADGGERLDEDAIAPYCGFLRAGGVDGILALGTTGEGILLEAHQRRAALEAFLAGPLPVIAHCGAQSTAETIALAAHAAQAGAAAVAVIAPPYFALDGAAQLAHFRAAAAACEPLPFYVYEFERASGYVVPPAVVERLAELAPNLAGLKVSDSPFARVEPYLSTGLEVLVGAEGLIGESLAAGGAGAVSGLAAAFPEVVVEAVRSGNSTAAGELRAAIEAFPRHAALKTILAMRGVPLREDVRAPLRGLTGEERAGLRRLVETFELALTEAG